MSSWAEPGVRPGCLLLVGRQMDAVSSSFDTLAEISTAIAGFASVVVVFSDRDQALDAVDRARVWILLSYSLIGVTLGVLPGLLVSMGNPSAASGLLGPLD